jgi:hypothetical protein
MKKLTVKQQKELVPDDDIREAFLNRDDIKCLSPAEQEARWKQAEIYINKFREQLSGIPAVILPS